MGKNSHNRRRTLTRGELTRRGWTRALIDALLPPPAPGKRGERTVMVWRRADVTAAEETEAFRQGRGVPQPRRETEPVTPEQAAENAAALLADAWADTEPPEGTAGLLARRYHEAILERFRRLPGTAKPKASTALSRLGAFLSLDRQKIPPEPALRGLAAALLWAGRNPNAPAVVSLRARYGGILCAVAERVLVSFAAEHRDANVDAMLAMDDFPLAPLLDESLGYIWSVVYVPRAIRRSLRFLAELRPEDEYPEARAMKRHFVIHTGGTNTGKTYAGFQRLRRAATGVYLAPLRLLALEAQELLLGYGVACSLTTGEEEDREDGDTHIAATAEKLELTRRYDVAVIDECQMIADPMRGFAWTRAILGVLAPEVHLCAAPEARPLLIRIIRSCGDTFELEEHERKTPLICMNRVIDYAGVQPGDALITFSKVGVLSVAEDLRAQGKEPAIIYGALPYATRRRQMEGFLSGRMQYVVSTDAIGMGLNLPIRRVIFMDTEKFDGRERRSLRPAEIKQIAGRAGRYGIYDRGYVGAMQNLSLIRAGLTAEVPPLKRAVVGFSDLVITVDFDLLEVLEVWSKMPTPEPYVKLDISRYITIITRIRQAGYTLSKEQELRAANIPFDETDPELMIQFYRLLKSWHRPDREVEQPKLSEREREHTLPGLELYCRKLDLYFSFCKAFECPVDLDALYDERERVADEINQILLHNLKNNIRFCVRCHEPLPLHHAGRMCPKCYAKNRRAFS